MKSKLMPATWGLALFSTGCLHPKIGPKSLPGDRAAYSTGVAESWKEQMLLNVIKLRYVDAPTFVDVGNIVVSYTLTQTASVGAQINSSALSAQESLGVGGVFSNTPTITYTPLTGSKYIQGLLTPLPPQVVFGAIQNGAAAHLVMLSTVVSINGLKNQHATLDGINPADPAFDRVRALVRKIQLSGGVRTYVKPDPKGPATVVALRQANIGPETLADIRELRRLLKLNQDTEEFSLVQTSVSSSDTEIAMLTRSVFSIMQNMAADVEVPAEDLAKNYVFRGYESRQGGIGDNTRMVRIHSGKQRSVEAFVAVKYAGNWFWIDKGDLHSKQMFLQLMNLFSMADTTPREPPPIVTIPSR